MTKPAWMTECRRTSEAKADAVKELVAHITSHQSFVSSISRTKRSVVSHVRWRRNAGGVRAGIRFATFDGHQMCIGLLHTYYQLLVAKNL